MVSPFTNRRTGQAEADNNFDDIRQIVNDINNGRVLDNVILEGIVLGTSATEVSHRLGRAPTGWIIIKKNANADVWEPSDSAQPSSLLKLQASASVTVNILIF